MLTRLFIGQTVTKARLALVGGLGLILPLVSLLLAARADRPIEGWVFFSSNYGLAVFIAIGALVVATAPLGNMAEDGSLVYVWLRPVSRLAIALAAIVSSLVVLLPLVAAATLSSGLIVGAPGKAIGGALAGALLAAAAYVGGFTLLSLLTRRPLPWGLAYILIWEGFVARAGAGAARLALASYARSLLSHASGVSLRLADRAGWTSVAVPLVFLAASSLLCGRRLRYIDVA